MDDAKKATLHVQLMSELMNPTIPKTEREHAAVREIERLQAELDALRLEDEECPVCGEVGSLTSCGAEYCGLVSGAPTPPSEPDTKITSADLDRCKKEMLEIADQYAWKPISKEWSFDHLDLLCADGSILREVIPQSDGDFYWNGAGPEIFIDPQFSSDVTHWRVAAHTPGDSA